MIEELGVANLASGTRRRSAPMNRASRRMIDAMFEVADASAGARHLPQDLGCHRSSNEMCGRC